MVFHIGHLPNLGLIMIMTHFVLQNKQYIVFFMGMIQEVDLEVLMIEVLE